MPIIYTETDLGASGIRTISPYTVITAQMIKRMEEGATAGTTEASPIILENNNGNGRGDISFRSLDGDPGGSADWAAGDWTVRIEITTSNMVLTWDAIGIAAVNAAITSHTNIGEATSLGISLSTTGVKSATVSGSSPASNKDHVQITLGISSTSAMNTTIGITPSQNIDTPILRSVATSLIYDDRRSRRMVRTIPEYI